MNSPQSTPNIKVFFFLALLLLLSHSFALSQTSPSYSEIRKEVYTRVNAYRSSLHLPSLRASANLNQLAQQHAIDMAQGRVTFSHKGFDNRFNKASKYFGKGISLAENIYYATFDAEQIAQGALQGWIDSPSHHKALKGSFNRTGIGVAKSREGAYFVVQLYLNDPSAQF